MAVNAFRLGIAAHSLRARFRPWPVDPMASWNTVLETYARSRRPRADLPPSVFLSEDEHTYAGGAFSPIKRSWTDGSFEQPCDIVSYRTYDA